MKTLLCIISFILLCNIALPQATNDIKIKGYILGMNIENALENSKQRFPECIVKRNTYDNITSIKVLKYENATPTLYAFMRLKDDKLVYCLLYPEGVAYLYNYYIYINPVSEFATIFHSAYFEDTEVSLESQTHSIKRDNKEIGTQEIYKIQYKKTLIEIYGNGSMDHDKINILISGNTPPGTIIMKYYISNTTSYTLQEKTIFD